jgi:hypothetical protein
VEILWQIRILHATLDLFGAMNVLRMPALRSTGSQDYPGFQVAIVTTQGMCLIVTGAMDTAHNKVGMASRMVTLNRMDIPSRMDMGIRMDSVSKMDTASRMHTINRVDVQVHARMEARVHEEGIKARGSTTALRIIMERRLQALHLTKECTQYLLPLCCPIARMPTCRVF